MPGKKKKFELVEDRQINIHEKYEIEYRTKQYKCTKGQLLDAIDAVGAMANQVEKYLKDKSAEQINSSDDEPSLI